jgi:hypothetical protein
MINLQEGASGRCAQYTNKRRKQQEIIVLILIILPYLAETSKGGKYGTVRPDHLFGQTNCGLQGSGAILWQNSAKNPER